MLLLNTNMKSYMANSTALLDLTEITIEMLNIKLLTDIAVI